VRARAQKISPVETGRAGDGLDRVSRISRKHLKRRCDEHAERTWIIISSAINDSIGRLLIKKNVPPLNLRETQRLAIGDPEYFEDVSRMSPRHLDPLFVSVALRAAESRERRALRHPPVRRPRDLSLPLHPLASRPPLESCASLF